MKIFSLQTLNQSMMLLCLFMGLTLFSGCAHQNMRLYENATSTSQGQTFTSIYFVESKEDQFGLVQRLAQALSQDQMPVESYSLDTLKGPQGSGVIFTPQGHILTCAHVLHLNPKRPAEGQRAKIWIQEKPYFAQILKVDHGFDLALLKLEKLQLETPAGEQASWPFIPLSQKVQPQLGQVVYAFGFPLSPLLGNATRVTQGIVSARVGFQDQKNHFQVSAAIQPGNSGGPVVNQQGEILGIVQSTLNSQSTLDYTGGVAPQNVNFAVNRKTIHQFLTEANLYLIEPLVLMPHRMPLADPKDSFATAEFASVRIQGPKAPQPLPGEQILTLRLAYDIPESSPVAKEILKTIALTTGQNITQTNEVKNLTIVIADYLTGAPLFQLKQTQARASLEELVVSTLEKLRPLLSSRYYPKDQEQAASNIKRLAIEKVQPVAFDLPF